MTRPGNPDIVALAAADLLEEQRKFFEQGFFDDGYVRYQTEPDDAVPRFIKRRLVRQGARGARVPFLVTEVVYTYWSTAGGKWQRLPEAVYDSTVILVPVAKTTRQLIGALALMEGPEMAITGKTTLRCRTTRQAVGEAMLLLVRASDAAAYVRQVGMEKGYLRG